MIHSPVDMSLSLFPHYSSSSFSCGHFYQITLWNTCKSRLPWITSSLAKVLLTSFPPFVFSPQSLNVNASCRDSYASDENYTTYYPPRELAAYIPAYLALLFVFVPILYMGLNMLSCPAVDSIDGMWDTQSNCQSMKDDVNARCVPFMDEGVNYSVPTICDEDVRSVNLRLRQNYIIGREKNWQETQIA